MPGPSDYGIFGIIKALTGNSEPRNGYRTTNGPVDIPFDQLYALILILLLFMIIWNYFGKSENTKNPRKLNRKN